MLLPDNADSGPKYIVDRLGDYPRHLSDHLGLFPHHAIGLVVIGLALTGVIIGVYRRPGRDGPLAAIALCSMLAVSTHFRFVGRYYFQVLPWIVYFATVAVLEGCSLALRWWRSPVARRVALGLAMTPLLVVLTVHANKLPSRVTAAQDFNDAGRQQIGPAHPDHIAAYDAVRRETGPDDVIWYFRARTMTLLTDRRAIQTTNADRGEQMADYVMLSRRSDFFEPRGLDATAALAWLVAGVGGRQLATLRPSPVNGGR